MPPPAAIDGASTIGRDNACCVFSANMRRASLDAICEPSEIACLNKSPDGGDEVADGSSWLAVCSGALCCAAKGIGDRPFPVGEDLEDLEGLGICGGSLFV